MKSKYLFGLMIGAGVVALGTGCGDDTTAADPTGTGGGTSATTSGSTTATTTGVGGGSTTTSNSTTTGVGGGGDGNDSFEEAEAIPVDEEGPQGDLDPIDTDADFYRFEGTAGQVIGIFTDAKPDNDEFGPAYPDLVITLFDADQNQIAQNDDPIPRNSNDSTLYTILPEAGTYYVKVQEFCASELGQGAANCDAAYFAGIEETGYALGIGTIDPASVGVVQESEAALGYELADPNTPGQYFLTLGYGTFDAASDSDSYTFTIPADTQVTQGREVGYFGFYPVGQDGNGSTATPADITILQGAIVIARVNGADYVGGVTAELSPPLEFGTEYTFVVNGANSGINPFYFFTSNGGGSNPVEAETLAPANNTQATAETLTATENVDGSISYFVEGDLVAAPADVDYFDVAVPAGQDTISIACGAQRSGSGLRGFEFTLVNADGTPVAGATATESASADALALDIAVPAGATELSVRIEAASQDAGVTSSFYRCGLHFRTAR